MVLVDYTHGKGKVKRGGGDSGGIYIEFWSNCSYPGMQVRFRFR